MRLLRQTVRRRSNYQARILRGFATLLCTLLVSMVGASLAQHGARAAGNGTLLLFDRGGSYGHVGEAQATMAANLIGRFEQVTARPVDAYQANDMDGFAHVVYVGSLYASVPLPAPFLNDVLTKPIPVLWMGNNLWWLTQYQDSATPSFQSRFGFTWTSFTSQLYPQLEYRGRSLTRAGGANAPLLATQITNTSIATGIGEVIGADAARLPWAVKANNLTYLSEVPFTYIDEHDRYLAFADLLFDMYAPGTVERHRGLVRLEDVGPASDPQQLRDIADLLFAENVPFSVHVVPFFVNPDLANNGANPVTTGLQDSPAVVAALQYMLTKGGRLVMHGTTHQYETKANPYDGQSGNDFEFYGSHVDSTSNAVILDGPLPDNNEAWTGTRLDQGLAEIAAVGLPTPAIWTTPHYASTVDSYSMIDRYFAARYERSLYFNGVLTGTNPDYTYAYGQYFPYSVRDVYGEVVLPENLGNETKAYNQHASRSPADIIANAVANLAVRDGFASFFWHPWLVGDPGAGIGDLQTIVQGIKALGYTFVAPEPVVYEPTADRFVASPPATTTTTTTAPTTTTESTTSTTSTTVDPPTSTTVEPSTSTTIDAAVTTTTIDPTSTTVDAPTTTLNSTTITPTTIPPTTGSSTTQPATTTQAPTTTNATVTPTSATSTATTISTSSTSVDPTPTVIAPTTTTIEILGSTPSTTTTTTMAAPKTNVATTTIGLSSPSTTIPPKSVRQVGPPAPPDPEHFVPKPPTVAPALPLPTQSESPMPPQVLADLFRQLEANRNIPSPDQASGATNTTTVSSDDAATESLEDAPFFLPDRGIVPPRKQARPEPNPPAQRTGTPTAATVATTTRPNALALRPNDRREQRHAQPRTKRPGAVQPRAKQPSAIQPGANQPGASQPRTGRAPGTISRSRPRPPEPTSTSQFKQARRAYSAKLRQLTAELK
jgi:uncharacterized protein YdaL